LPQTEHTGRSLFDKMQQIRQIFVLTRIRSDAGNNLFIKRGLTFEQFVESLSKPAAQGGCE
jgi:hypothetical protein